MNIILNVSYIYIDIIVFIIFSVYFYMYVLCIII